MTETFKSEPLDLFSPSDFKIPHVNLAYLPNEAVGNNGASDHVMSNFADSQNKVAGPLMSTNPVTYTWENIEVETDVVQGNIFNRKEKPTIRKRILDNVTGAVRPGEFLAIMGASGAGKTTLLNCLTLRSSGNLKIRGKRLLNGKEVDRDSLARISGYVQQDDLFIGTLKVGEILRFQALLRMDKHCTYSERMERVEQVLLEFGLTKCRNTLIGYPERGIKGISGGERKRLAFACEVLSNPSLMFCDEPTSGLDSYMAQNVVEAMRNLAMAGKAVVCTIHQPSSEVFELFDRILLMAEGRTAFLGPIDEALQFFSTNGMPCPTNYNPADFYIFTLAVMPGKEVDCKQKVKYICDAYDNSEARRRVDTIVHQEHYANGGGIVLTKKKSSSPYKAGWFSQFSAVLWRSWTSVMRDPQMLTVKAASSICISLLIALIYQGQTMEVESIQNIQGVLFLFITNTTFENVFAVINTFCFEIPIFLREHFNGMYRVDVYFLSKTIAELLIFIVLPFVSFAIPYYIIGLNPEVERFFIGGGIIIIIANVVASFGYFVSCLARTPQLAMIVAAPMILPIFLFGGFFLKNGSVPVYLDWIRYLSWFMYGNEALSINQWHGVTFNSTKCKYAEFNVTSVVPPDIVPDNIFDFIVSIFTGFQESIICSGDDILAAFNFSPDNFMRDILCLCALFVVFRIMAFLALLSKTYRKI